MKHREQSQVDAVHAFKLLCHDLDIIQHHMRARAQKFKAIALCFFAFAALDAWVVASAAGLVADSAVGTYVMVLAQAFLSIDWTRCSIEIALDGSTRIVRRRPEQHDDINIWWASAEETGPDAAEKDEAVACNICRMFLNGPHQYQEHLKGKRHRKNMHKQRKQGCSGKLHAATELPGAGTEASAK